MAPKTGTTSKGKAGCDLEAVAELCEHLELAQQTGDGDLDLDW